jgi:hypothetical protein
LVRTAGETPVLGAFAAFGAVMRGECALTDGAIFGDVFGESLGVLGALVIGFVA